MKTEQLERFLSDAARSATRSDIRELLKLLSQPEIISLAGGMPSPTTFPVEALSRLIPAVLERDGAAALQYGPTEGDRGLRRLLVERMAEDGVEGLDEDRVLITTASQQALDLCGRTFLSAEDVVVCGLPSYLGALGAFAATGARLSGVELDDRGLRCDALEQRLVDLRRVGVRPKLLYLIPDFQNPTGVTLDLERRLAVLEIAAEFDLLIVEDSPYRELRYVGEAVPSLARLDREGRVISLFTFSKILCPGFRLGWVVADAEVISRLVVTKQSMDLCTSPFAQVVAREFLRSGKLPARVRATRALYAERRAAMLAALEQYVDPAWGVDWTRPEGGMFVWVRLPEWMEARRLFERCLVEKVAFVCGSAFHCDGSGHNTLRLNFSFPDPELLVEGVRRFASALGSMISEGAPAAGGFAPAEPATPLVSGKHALHELSMQLAMTELVS